MHTITVSAAQGGWAVRAPSLAHNEMLFLSGRQAERAARSLGGRIAWNEPVEVQIFTRNGALAGQFKVSASTR